MNDGPPLLVCKGIAESRGLRCSGARNWLSALLPTRNEEWLNGTHPGFLIAFGGSNSDTKPNDRLPIIECTHERSCTRKCVKKNHAKQTKKLIRLSQRIQAITNGYFGGYIGKRQPSGKAELKKCINHMYTLRNKIQGQSLNAKQRAVSGRMITDLEMNGTYRGAVEIFNLCRHLHAQDVLMAECIRTFDTAVLDGRAWLYRLGVEVTATGTEKAEWNMLVPKTRKPHQRSAHAKANDFDVYGLRPMRSPWRLLSPYEFFREWRAEPLLSPLQYDQQGVPRRTSWREDVPKNIRTGDKAAKPGDHYTVLPSLADTEISYITFPEEPRNLYVHFRHSWVLVRKRRPDVVCIEGTQMPRANRNPEENCKYFNVFFRPWTLTHGCPEVPHVSLLNLTQSSLQEAYSRFTEPNKRRRVPDKATSTCSLSSRQAWMNYIDGHVVSKNAERLIKNMLMQTIASSQYDEEANADEEKDESDVEEEIPPLKLTDTDLKTILGCGKESDDSEQLGKNPYGASSRNRCYRENMRKHSKLESVCGKRRQEQTKR